GTSSLRISLLGVRFNSLLRRRRRDHTTRRRGPREPCKSGSAPKRYERFADDNRAIERWNQLIGERAKLTPESAEAKTSLRTRELEPGTRSVKAFRVDANTIVGVYLLTPSPPEDASVLESILRVPTP
nr:hypothetical protein [Myxococcota bacterium]